MSTEFYCFKTAQKIMGHFNQHIYNTGHTFIVLCVLQSYSMAVYLVKQQSSTALLQRLRAKGIRNPDHSRALSKKTRPLFNVN